MQRAGRPVVVAATVMVGVTGAWVGGQALLLAANARETAAIYDRIEAARVTDGAARGITVPAVPAEGVDASYWWPLLQANTVHLIALAVLGLVLVMAGRRRAWAGLGLLAVIRPDLAESPLRWLDPVGYGWSGAWITAGTAVGEPAPGLPVLPHVGAVVDLLVMALPAAAYLLASRGAPRPDIVPTRQVLARLCLPGVLVIGGLAAYATIDLNGQPYVRVSSTLVVLTAAALLATTRLGPIHAVVIVSLAAGLASPEVSGALAFVASGGRNGEFWSTVLGNVAPLFAVAVVGGACAAYGPAVASSYRKLVRRPAAAV